MRYTVLVKPGSKKGPLVERGPDGQLIIYVRQRAAEGKANDAVTELLAAYLGVTKSAVKIIRGHASRHKIIEISG